MKTVEDILSEAADLGVRCATRTFWKYLELGLLPTGEKIPGRGNVLYFPDDMTMRLILILFLSKEMAIPLSDLAYAPWPESLNNSWPASGRRLDDLLTAAKSKYEETKQAGLRDFVQWLLAKGEKSPDPTRAAQRYRKQASRRWDVYRPGIDDSSEDQ